VVCRKVKNWVLIWGLCLGWGEFGVEGVVCMCGALQGEGGKRLEGPVVLEVRRVGGRRAEIRRQGLDF
jgi:hypothetical protein